MAAILERLRIADDKEHGYETARWINPDIAPMPLSRRTWGYWSYLGWGSIANVCITVWTAAAANLSLGLTLPQTIGVMILARVFITALVIANGWNGAQWHIGFAVNMRMIFGMRGAYIGQVMRILLSIVWYGSQAWLGGLCVSAMISSWSQDFLLMKNTFPESAHMVTRDFVGFVIFQIISVPFLMLRPENSKMYVIAANIVVMITMISITIWATVKGGRGPLFDSGARQLRAPAGMTDGWAWLYGISSTIGGIAAGIVNQNDFTRFVRKSGDQIPGIIASTLVFGMIVPILALLTASASMLIWDTTIPYWNPLQIIIQWMIDDYSSGARAAAFFCSLAFVFGQIAENVLGNGYAAGMDLAGLFPKWINIRRGSLICALLSTAVLPWEFYNTASVFVAVMASFSVFLAPMAGLMIADYFVVRRRKVQLSQLYSGDPQGPYWYFYGFNWRGFVAWIVGFTPGMPGMIANVNTSVTVNRGIFNYYLGNYVFGFLISFSLYISLCLLSKPQGAGDQDEMDIYGTFTEGEISKRGIAPFQLTKGVDFQGEDGVERAHVVEEKMEKTIGV